ncbi:hypothetical protein [Chryseobacterium sp. Hurlbut01]|uniref:hypothetical protein n=1 Tax=Chryseobacterium sp. Hurlbut01 TaxID=1681828 RepID=UPI00067B3F95|nr:hypothetical protein [Chryseobacterium sp. Hurlbut01]
MKLQETSGSFLKIIKIKVLDLYYDRSGNQNSKTQNDRASAVKRHIEFDNEKKTDWTVNMMSLGQKTIYQEEEFNLMKEILGETNPKLPKVLIDLHQCRELKSSMEVAKQVIKLNSKGVRGIYKNKSSESIPMSRRPMWSTNMSDAFKYYMYRPKYVNIMKKIETSGTSYAPTMH